MHLSLAVLSRLIATPFLPPAAPPPSTLILTLHTLPILGSPSQFLNDVPGAMNPTR